MRIGKIIKAAFLTIILLYVLSICLLGLFDGGICFDKANKTICQYIIDNIGFDSRVVEEEDHIEYHSYFSFMDEYFEIVVCIDKGDNSGKIYIGEDIGLTYLLKKDYGR